MSENTDTRTAEQKAPKKADKAPKAPKAPKTPKAPKAPKEPKVKEVKAPWEASDEAKAVVAIMNTFAEKGDKKTLAYFVAEAINCRVIGKEAREMLTSEQKAAVDASTSAPELTIEVTADEADEA